MADSDEIGELTEYFTDMYWTDSKVNDYARNILDDYLDSQGLSHVGAENLLRHGIQGLDRDKFRDKFQVFLEKRLNFHHNGSLENPEIVEDDIGVEREYVLGYFDTDLAPTHTDEAFMTSIIRFENSEGQYGKEVEYLDKEDGLEAIRHLLEHDEGKVDEIMRFGIKENPEKATQAYRIIAQESPVLAEELLEDIRFRDESLESQMKAIYFRNNPEIFENFSEDLDF